MPGITINVRTIEYTGVALGCTLPPVWLVPTGVYLIKFLIGTLSYSPCSKPSRTVLLPDVTHTMYARHPSKHESPPFTAPYYYSSLDWPPLRPHIKPTRVETFVLLCFDFLQIVRIPYISYTQ